MKDIIRSIDAGKVVPLVSLDLDAPFDTINLEIRWKYFKIVSQ